MMSGMMVYVMGCWTLMVVSYGLNMNGWSQS